MQAPPPGAIVLFDGKDTSAWVKRGTGGQIDWPVRDGYVEIVPGSGDIQTVERFGDCRVHLEFWLPLMADAVGQARANSGVFLLGRYEVQILDSFQVPTNPATACGSLYHRLPATNLDAALRPPRQWQSLDITCQPPRLGKKPNTVPRDGRLTVKLNGVTVIDDGRFSGPTLGGDPEVPGPGPLRLQDHGAPVRFRSIWVSKLSLR